MRLRLHHHDSPGAKINVTPLIDVVMVLIVFYLIVGRLATDRQTRLDLPASAIGASESATAALVINIMPSATSTTAGTNADTAAADIIIDGRALTTIEQLEALLLARFPDAATSQPVIHVRADRTLDFAKVRPVLEACRAAGLTSVKLVASRSASDTSAEGTP
jgi:biopolymer transport protein ExbD